MKHYTIALSFAGWLSLAAGACATTVYSDNFNGGLHLPWTFYDQAAASPTATTISTALNDLRLTANTPPPYNTFVAGVVGVGNPSYDFTDVTVRATVFPLTNAPLLAGGTGLSDNDIGIALRMDPVLLNEYTLIVDYVAHTLTMSAIVGGSATDAYLTIPGFDATKAYTLEFSAIGTQLTGKVFDGPTLLQTISVSNGLYTHGYVGLGASINNNTPVTSFIGAGFDDFTATVPEPSGLALGGFALLCVAGAVARRRFGAQKILS